MRLREYADGYIVYADNGDWLLGKGTAFPSGVAPNNALFYRQDLEQWCHYSDGAWVTDQTPKGRLIVPMGEIDYFNTTGTAVTISGASDGSTNLVEVAPATALTTGSFEFDQSASGRLRYTGTVTRMFHVACTWSFVAATGGDVFVLALAINGTPLTTAKVIQTGAGTNNNGNASHAMVELAEGDYLSLFVGNLTAGRNATFKDVNLFAMGM